MAQTVEQTTLENTRLESEDPGSTTTDGNRRRTIQLLCRRRSEREGRTTYEEAAARWSQEFRLKKRREAHTPQTAKTEMRGSCPQPGPPGETGTQPPQRKSHSRSPAYGNKQVLRIRGGEGKKRVKEKSLLLDNEGCDFGKLSQ